ncbi:hypothetical protein ASU31_10380 [Pedobacter ginsenosidimutans]|uniref:Uncharacterized protein n=2 Tax=Pedobacter ginsenosidimutans TaxID=687842 RepID=A0A0T5VRR6_9SPHI|nr:hypothetical protein ASU31_10380 [Pedobacter ginsenosidimutans]
MPFPGSAYLYGEHKKIGDAAFTKFKLACANLPNGRFFFDALLDGTGSFENFGFLSDGGNPISYGVLNGLNGDHEVDPLLLKEHLRNRESVIQKIIAMHQSYIDQGQFAAPDGKLVALNMRYALLAVVNMAHFYLYGKDLRSQIAAFNPAWIKDAQDESKVAAVFRKLEKTNALTMYVTVHLVAMDLAAQAGKIKEANPMQAKLLLQQAILFNSFADHFLEDAFSSGHLVVNRSPLASFTNNKALHDFYSMKGSMVVNRGGEVWKAYGDGSLAKSGTERVVEAVELSLSEVFEAYSGKVIKQTDSDSLLEFIKPLSLIPIPYNTDLDKVLPDSLITKDARNASQLLPERNFIRSRIGNSIVFGFNTRAFRSNYLQSGEFRLKFGLFSKRYEYNASGTKKGMLDYFNGYTLSYGFGNIGRFGSEQPRERVHLLKGGIRSNYDWWISDTRFLGFTSYLEGGLEFTGGKTKPVFVPSAGVQLGPLLKVNYYNMPLWLRIPAQLVLPLEVRIGSVIGNGKPAMFSGLDLNYVF